MRYKKPLEVKFSPNKFNLRTKSPNLLKHVPSVHFSNSKTMYIHREFEASQHKKRHNDKPGDRERESAQNENENNKIENENENKNIKKNTK